MGKASFWFVSFLMGWANWIFMPMTSVTSNEDWIVYASSSKAFGFGQTMGSKVFKPLTPTYLHF
ncbi:hypothetical protein HanRHA438_Chr15g0688221 [Helianthus annuus]|nr:hypothetical protein HanRHA438_Chr15g0688221 [Helianthus annuus]